MPKECGEARTGYITSGFSKAQKRAGVLCSPCIVRKFPINIPKSRTKKEKIRIGFLTGAFSGAQKRVELLRNLYILGCLQCHARGATQK